MKIAIVGCEDRAEALALLIAAAGNEALAWEGRLPDLPPVAAPRGVALRPSLPALTEEADLVLLDVAPGMVRGVIRAMRPGPATRIILATRGLEFPSGKRLSRVVEEESACLRIGALAGPILVSEVRRRSPSALVVASRFHEVGVAASAALMSPLCRVYPSEDLAGVELSGALVEVVTAALGAARGLGMGVGLQSLAVTRGIAEGGRLAARAGGDTRTFSGLAGAGELVACVALGEHGGGTDTPGLRRGLALARGETDPALVACCDALIAVERDLPITQGVRAVARGEARVADVMAALLGREQREELG